MDRSKFKIVKDGDQNGEESDIIIALTSALERAKNGEIDTVFIIAMEEDRETMRWWNVGMGRYELSYWLQDFVYDLHIHEGEE